MARYKVLQDIEAEDKLVGPLTLRQFIYAAGAVICLYICFIAVTKGAPYLLAVFFPPAMVTGFFAFPWGREQPTEIWALAKIRFMIKPRRRIWDQSGVRDLVTITAPKKVVVDYTKGLSQTEVRSRLRALADTIDSRGWAVKNVTSAYGPQQMQDPDRLLGVANFTQAIPDIDIPPADDMLDEEANPVAQKLDQMIEKSTEERHERVLNELSRAREHSTELPAPQKANTSASSSPWFLNQQPQPKRQSPVQVASPYNPAAAPAPVAAAEPTLSDEELLQQVRRQVATGKATYEHMRTISPLGSTPGPQPVRPSTNTPVSDQPDPSAQQSPQPSVTPQPDPATLKNTTMYANNDDLTIATIARQVNKQPDEVVISLH